MVPADRGTPITVEADKRGQTRASLRALPAGSWNAAGDRDLV
jgi:hypothetical protein